MHNPKLADKMNVSVLNRRIIDKLHILRELIEHQQTLTEDEEISKNLYEQWVENERLLQELWGFPLDDNYIRFWTYPTCRCPSGSDQEEHYGYGMITSELCKLHWQKEHLPREASNDNS